MRSIATLCLSIVILTSVAFALPSQYTECVADCTYTEIRMSSEAVYGQFLISSIFDFDCFDNYGEGCQFALELVIYEATNDPNNPWGKISDDWFNNDGLHNTSFVEQCGVSDSEQNIWPKIYTFTPGNVYQVQMNVYNGTLNDAMEGLLPVFCTTTKQVSVPRRTGP